MIRRFQTLLRLHEHRVEAARQELGRAQQQIEQLVAQIDARVAERDAPMAAIADPRWRVQYEAFCRSSRSQETQLRRELHQAEAVREAARLHLIDARARLRSFETLQGQEDQRLARKARRRDEHALVEHAVQAWLRDRVR